MANWYYMKNGQRCGPVDTDALKHLAETGQLQPADMIWREGMPNWAPASGVEGVFEGGFPTAAAGQPVAQPVTPLMAQYLLATRPWVLFLSIMGFIMAGLALFAGVGMMIIGGLAGGRTPGLPIPMAALGLIYLVLAGLYAAPAWLLFNYAAAIKRYRYSASSRDIEAALASQKSFWRFVGIMTIVVLVLYVVIFLIAMIVAMAGVSRGMP